MQNTMCSEVLERIVEVVETPDPTDPDHDNLEQLRAHANECPDCRLEQAEMIGFLLLDRALTGKNPSEDDQKVVDRIISARYRFEMSVRTGESPTLN